MIFAAREVPKILPDYVTFPYGGDYRGRRSLQLLGYCRALRIPHMNDLKVETGNVAVSTGLSVLH